VLHRVGDVEEMLTHCSLGLARTACAHGVDDRHMLGHGRSGAAGDEDRAVLVAHRLGVQALNQASGRGVVGDLEERGVQDCVRVRCAEEVAALEKLVLTGETGLEPGDSRLVDALCGLTNRKALQNGSRLQDLHGLVIADASHSRTSMGLANDEPVLLETDERRADGASRHLERRRELRLDEASVWRDVPAHDGLAKGVVSRGDRHHAPPILRNVAKIVNNSVFMSPVIRHAHVVAVLGLGEAGGRLATDLAALGVDVRGYDPDSGRDVPSTTRASDPASAAGGSDVVLSVCSARAAPGAAAACLPALSETTVYADLNTASPALKRELATLVGGVGARFADVALLGPVPTRGLQAPVLASGEGARAFADLFEPLGMPVDVISEEAGDAAALKLVRSVFMKGLAAAVVESMAAAERSGHADWLAGEIAAMIGRPFFERALEGSRKHAARRVDEMEAARDLLVELGVEPRVASASAAQLAELAEAER
jgi:3-hydroxyisobutyrate dehydrogenase-like beta-hydroxyacid dehydrogenase